MRFIHGGSWLNKAPKGRWLRVLRRRARASYRSYEDPSLWYNYLGFRCVRGAFLAWRSIRGGSWGNKPSHARASSRSYDGPSRRSSRIGFRCVRRLA
jgi:formylglycine-generating enzyme required for sulfatase activity